MGLIFPLNKTTVYKNSIYRGKIMLRQSDIRSAFVNSITQNPKGYLCLRTGDFVRELQSKGIHFSGNEANQWIKRNQTYFVDKTTNDNENRLWILRNMGRVL